MDTSWLPQIKLSNYTVLIKSESSYCFEYFTDFNVLFSWNMIMLMTRQAESKPTRHSPAPYSCPNIATSGSKWLQTWWFKTCPQTNGWHLTGFTLNPVSWRLFLWRYWCARANIGINAVHIVLLKSGNGNVNENICRVTKPSVSAHCSLTIWFPQISKQLKHDWYLYGFVSATPHTWEMVVLFKGGIINIFMMCERCLW